MEEIDQAEDQGKYTKKDCGMNGTKYKNKGKGKENIYRTVQRSYSQGHHQNQATHVGLEKEL